MQVKQVLFRKEGQHSNAYISNVHLKSELLDFYIAVALCLFLVLQAIGCSS